jgi:hypothetical protein
LIGRVGALAVALGIGAAVASSPGIAVADTGGSDSSSDAGSASTSSDTTNESPSTKGSPSTPQSSTSDQPSGPTYTSEADADTKDADTEDDDAKADDSTSTAPQAEEEASPTTPSTSATPADPKSKKPHGQPSVTAETARGATVSDDPSPADDDQSGTRSMRQAQNASAPPDIDSHAVQVEVQRAAVVTAVNVVPTAAPEPQTAVAHPVGFVTGLVSGLLSAVGLNPQATTGPATPPQSPTLWAMLAWVRREIGHVFAPATATANATGVTSLVEPAASIAAVSPLGTQQQLTAEKVATQTVNTLPVQLMKLVLRFGFLNAAQQQFNLVGGPDQENLAQLDRAVDEYAMGAAFQQQLLNSMDPTVVMQVAPPHTWYGQDVDGSRILYDNPDTIYRFMGVNRASTYVITGRFADLADGVRENTNFSLLTGLQGTTAQNISGRDLVVNPDGTFTITVSAAPGEPGQNHLQLTSDATLIATRNTLSDWTNQEPMTLSIQRVGGPPNSLFSQFGGFAIPVIGPLVVNTPLLTTLVSLIPPLADPPPLMRGVVTAAVMLLGIQREAQYIAVATTDPATGARIPPNVLKNPTRNAEFLATQLQSAGYFQLADDEALVLTIDPGDATYFVVPVTNDWTITDNYWDQQTSLNNVQAKAIDGVYTIVISPTDPDVANWVSTGGLNQGTISIRFQDLPLNPTHLPTVHSQVVPLSQLGSVLPANTIYVTPAERAAQLEERKAGFDNRFAPYSQ